VSEPQPASHNGTRELLIVLGAVTAVSVLLGVYLFVQYSRVMGYVRGTIGYCSHLSDDDNTCIEPAVPPEWQTRAFSPEECVDGVLEWARGCHGIKSMCDMYVEPVIHDCLETQDRTIYCTAIAPFAVTTYFGASECRARGVRREVDKEACANAYRTIASWCEDLIAPPPAPALDGSGVAP
jgi:hypothetical protein